MQRTRPSPTRYFDSYLLSAGRICISLRILPILHCLQIKSVFSLFSLILPLTFTYFVVAYFTAFALPSGKRLHNYGKSPFFMGKSTISMVIFHSYFDITRGYLSSQLSCHPLCRNWMIFSFIRVIESLGRWGIGVNFYGFSEEASTGVGKGAKMGWFYFAEVVI